VTDELAERLLVSVLGWGPADVRQHLGTVQALARWKYDAYERFAHGRRFVESLALWLEQFKTNAERRAAFEFVCRRLIFVSEPEMTNLVEMAYPDFVRPYLLKRIAEEAGVQFKHPAKWASGSEFLLRQRQCLFLGLSDGARTDVFRRSNSPALSHEQILLTSEVEKGRAKKLLVELETDLHEITAPPVSRDQVKFRTVVLLDDFSGSGLSYLRMEDGKASGKIARFLHNLLISSSPLETMVGWARRIIGLGNPMAKLVDPKKLEILLVLYTGTHQARQHLEREFAKVRKLYNIHCEVMITMTRRLRIRIRGSEARM
jgi:hypothetical protein